MKFFLPLLALVSTLCASHLDFSVFDAYQERWTRDEIEQRLGKYLQKDGRVASFFTISDEALVLYAAPDTQKEREVEYRLRFAKELGKRKQSSGRKDLVGVKIALDPGHFGGPYAKMEQRFIDIPPSLDRSSPIRFDEGTLCLLTAHYLKVLLEKEGAIVLMTRDQVGKGVYEVGFFDWLKDNSQLWGQNANLGNLFRKYYYPLDLRARAEKINAFGPDLSLIIHYNAQHVEEEYNSNNCVASQNYNLVFVPGAFCRNELALQESRYEFMRLLVSDDLEHSHKLSQSILRRLSKTTGVPVVQASDGVSYLKGVCLEIEEGIYARNLALTRLVHGPVCYGEALIQNNIDECLNLSRTDFVIGGQKCSSRVKQIAEAYFEGIKSFLLHKE